MDEDGCGKNTHLSFFLTIMKKEYDALLQWPFRHTVTLALLDQDGGKNIAQSFKPESTSSSFQRPRNQMNVASGCPMFAPLSVLNNSSYVKDNTMFLKCEKDAIMFCNKHYYTIQKFVVIFNVCHYYLFIINSRYSLFISLICITAVNSSISHPLIHLIILS